MSLIKRSVKGEPLTAVEHDRNLEYLDARTSGFAAPSLAALLADRRNTDAYPVGSVVRVEEQGFRYKVAANTANDHHLATAGGIKLYVLPVPGFGLPFDAFGARGDNATDNHPFFVRALKVAGREPIRLSAGIYYVSKTVSIKVPARIVGAGTGTNNNRATVVRFPINTAGFRAETRGAWQDKRMYRFETNIGLLSGGNATYFAHPLSYTPPTKAHPYAEIGGHVVCMTGEYYTIAPPDAVDHTHTSSGVKLYLRIDPEEVPDPVNQASGGAIENLVVEGGGTNNEDRTLHGIKIQSTFRLNNVSVRYFGGDGVRVAATVDGNYISGENYGNANNFAFYNLTVRQNGQDGLHVRGADANAGTVVELDSALNSRFGINERSFLGNNYISCHLDGNGSPGNMPGIPGGNAPDQASCVTFGGQRYSPHPASTLQQLVDTQPDDATPVHPAVEGGTALTLPVWIATGGLGTNYARAWSASQPVGTYVLGGSYIALRATQRNTFIACYDESGSAGSYISGNNLMLGGILSERMFGGYLTGRDGSALATPGITTSTPSGHEATFGAGSDPSAIVTFKESGATQPWRLQVASNDWVLQHQNSPSRRAFLLSGANTTQQFGTGAALPYQIAFPVIGVGSGANARRQTTGTAAPTTGNWARGDIVWNVSPSAGGTAGWICTAAGTPGIWKTFGAISP
jgi:hypothetical protein